MLHMGTAYSLVKNSRIFVLRLHETVDCMTVIKPAYRLSKGSCLF